MRTGFAPLLSVSYAWHLPAGLIALAVGMDLLLGDPGWLPHPVRLIGRAIELGESAAWSGDPDRDLRRGAAVAIGVAGAAVCISWILISTAESIAPALGAAGAVLAAWTTIAIRSLDQAAASAQHALEEDNLCAARGAMPALVGRDPHSLDRDGMIRAAIESVAESSSDAVVAPLLYLFVGGPAAAIAYKAINTLDSMIGHTSARYLYFGRWAARMDDLANLIPARLSAGCLIAAAAILRRSPHDALSTCRADARRHPSPNAGFPEAAMAGALGLQLGGPAVYGGEVEMRALIGVARRAPRVDDIAAARQLMWVASALALGLMWAARLILKPLWAI